MDRLALIAISAVAIGCGSPGRATPVTPLSRGVLSYAAAAHQGLVYAVELDVRFELAAYRLADRRVLWRRDLGPAEYDVQDLAVTEDSIWVASRDGTVRSFDRHGGKPGRGWHLGASVTAVVVDSDGRRLYTATEAGVLCARRLADGALLQCVVAHPAAITDLDIAGDRLASVARDGSVVEWRLPALVRQRHTVLSGSANAVRFGPSGTLAVATSARPLQRSEAVARAEDAGFPDLDPSTALVLWTADGRVRVLHGHQAPITDVVWVDDRTLVTSSWDRSLRAFGTNGRSRVLASFSYLVHGLTRAGPAIVACAWAREESEPATSLVPMN